MEGKKMLNNKMLRLILIASMCIVSIGGVFLGLVKWGFPLSDKEILDSAIRKEFMFEEFGIRTAYNGTAVKVLINKQILEYYVELARGDYEVMIYARFSRFWDYTKRKGDNIKSKLYYWNYKISL